MKRLAIEVAGVTVTARLYEDKAPNAVALLASVLPLQGSLHHARWSGNAAYVQDPALMAPDLAPENHVSFPHPGSVTLFPAGGTILFSYGQSQARTVDGNVWVSHCGELDGATGDIFTLFAETQRKGVKTISLRLMEDA